jgi:predicted thioredoxin/glutaredoxin
MNTPDPDNLSAKLRTWTVEPQIPGSFQREVWQRIAARQTERAEAWWPRMVQWLSTQLVRPQYATVLVVLSLSASIGIAHVQAQGTNAKLAKMLEARYAASVDPLAMSR